MPNKLASADSLKFHHGGLITTLFFRKNNGIVDFEDIYCHFAETDIGDNEQEQQHEHAKYHITDIRNVAQYSSKTKHFLNCIMHIAIFHRQIHVAQHADIKYRHYK